MVQQELRSRTTSDFIKWCCIYAENFDLDDNGEFIDGVICPDGCEYELEDIIEFDIIFPFLLYRTVEGINKRSKGYLNFIKIDIDYISYWATPEKHNMYLYVEYTSTTLVTQKECAIWHCLLDIFKEGSK